MNSESDESVGPHRVKGAVDDGAADPVEGIYICFPFFAVVSKIVLRWGIEGTENTP